MANFTVRKGCRYRATIELGWLEQLADNDTIAERLREAGFTEVVVAGSGATRLAEGLWPHPDASAGLPSQIAEVVEMA